MSDLVGYEFDVENGRATVTGASVQPTYVNIDVRRPDSTIVQSSRAASAVRARALLEDWVPRAREDEEPAPTDNIFVRIQTERALREREGSATSPPAREDPSIEA